MSVLRDLKPSFSCLSPGLSSTNHSLLLIVKHSLCEETHEGAGLVGEASLGKRDVPGGPLFGGFLDGQLGISRRVEIGALDLLPFYHPDALHSPLWFLGPWVRNTC